MYIAERALVVIYTIVNGIIHAIRRLPGCALNHLPHAHLEPDQSLVHARLPCLLSGDKADVRFQTGQALFELLKLTAMERAGGRVGVPSIVVGGGVVLRRGRVGRGRVRARARVRRWSVLRRRRGEHVSRPRSRGRGGDNPSPPPGLPGLPGQRGRERVTRGEDLHIVKPGCGRSLSLPTWPQAGPEPVGPVVRVLRVVPRVRHCVVVRSRARPRDICGTHARVRVSRVRSSGRVVPLRSGAGMRSCLGG